MSRMQVILSILSLAVVALTFVTLRLRRAMRRVAAEQIAVEQCLDAEIQRQRLLRSVEHRLQVALTVEYDLAASEALEMIQDPGILRDVVTSGLRPVLKMRSDLSSDPAAQWANEPYVSVTFTLENRSEDIVIDSSDRRLVRITETYRQCAISGGDPTYPGAGTSWDPGPKRIVWEILLVPNAVISTQN